MIKNRSGEAAFAALNEPDEVLRFLRLRKILLEMFEGLGGRETGPKENLVGLSKCGELRG